MLSKIDTVRKNIVILSASQFISDIGTASYISFVNLWLIQIFKDSVLVGTIVSITEITMFFLSPLITTFIKGKNIKTMLVASDYLRAAVMVLLFFLSGHINTVIIISIFILLSTLNCVFDGAAMVVIKRIGAKSDVVKLNTFLVLLANASLLIGQYAGGKLFTIDGIKEILIINAVSFFVSGLINQFLHRDYCVPTQPVKETIIKDIISGIQTVIQNKKLTVFIIMTLLINIHIAVASFTAYFVFSGNAGSIFVPVQYTYFIMAGTIGNIIGLTVVSLSGDKIFNLRSLAPLLLIMMCCRLLHFINSSIIYVCSVNGCIFIITGIINSLLGAYTMRAIDEQYLGQYYSAFGNLNALLSPVITYTLGYILRSISPATVYTSSGFILLLPVLYIRMRMKKFDKKEVKL